MTRFKFFILAVSVASALHAQSSGDTSVIVDDSIVADTNTFTVSSAREFVHEMIEHPGIWRTKDEQIKSDLERLLDQTTETYDSIEARLLRFNYQGVDIIYTDIFIPDTLNILWLNDSSFILESPNIDINNYIVEEIEILLPEDTLSLVFPDSIPDENRLLDSSKLLPDTIFTSYIDTAALEAAGLTLYTFDSTGFNPPLEDGKHRRSSRLGSEINVVILTDTVSVWVAEPSSPFQYLSGENQLDSLHLAVETLVSYVTGRDSTLLFINDLSGQKFPFWITSGMDDYHRFWVKNYKKDSVTLWIGNPGSDEISLVMEDDINLSRLEKEEMDTIPLVTNEIDKSLVSMELLKPISVFWDYNMSNAFTFNQTFLSNWSKGGENSLSLMMDIMGSAIYTDTEAKIEWTSSARIQYGTLITEEQGLRKNTDLVEFNSKLNKNVKGKFHLSTVFYMKNQLAKGYNYPNDSVVVSKFLNPGSLTVGLGVDYKPIKNTSINLSPLSYKNTFVLDTALIDQTKHGITNDKRSKQELGSQLLVNNKISLMEDMTMSNTLRLFSNFLNNPQNIDVDWEMIVDKKISWFLTIRLNLHLIYDDDTRFPVFDSNDQPVLLPDGSQKKSPRAQFQEFLGLSVLFVF